MSTPVNMHGARMALNQDSELRKWAEAWLKDKERAIQPTMTDEEFAKHWLYVRPSGCMKELLRLSLPTESRASELRSLPLAGY